MASMEGTIDGAALMRQFTLTLDMSRVARQAFGPCRWRLRLALWLIALAARVLRVGIEVDA